MEMVKYIFMFLLGTTVLNFFIALGARLKTNNKKFNTLIFYWVSLVLTYAAVAALSGSEKEIAFAYFFQVVPTFTMVKILMDSKGIKNNLKFWSSLWAISALISSALLTMTDAGFTLSLLPVTLGTVVISFKPTWKTLVTDRHQSNWIEKGMGLVFITGIVNHFNYAFFRLDPASQWWGWSVSIAQYQCLSIILPLLINHQNEEKERKNISHALNLLSGKNSNFNLAIDDLYRFLELQIAQKEELTRKLSHSNESLEEEREINEILIKTVSHDLSNPLTVINAYVDMMASGRIPEKDRSMIFNKIKSNTNSALDMISRIRTAIVTRGQAEMITLHSVSIDRAIHKVIDSFDAKLKHKGLRIRYENRVGYDSFVTAEENALTEHVFSNVLSNAIKFSYENSSIDISVSELNEIIKIEFKDHGAGIANTRLERKLLHSTDGTQGEAGTGFGFMVLGYFLRKFGGTYSISSEGEGLGTTVSIYLKKAKARETNLHLINEEAHLLGLTQQ